MSPCRRLCANCSNVSCLTWRSSSNSTAEITAWQRMAVASVEPLDNVENTSHGERGPRKATQTNDGDGATVAVVVDTLYRDNWCWEGCHRYAFKSREEHSLKQRRRRNEDSGVGVNDPVANTDAHVARRVPWQQKGGNVCAGCTSALRCTPAWHVFWYCFVGRSQHGHIRK
jgi:hypothetical protein